MEVVASEEVPSKYNIMTGGFVITTKCIETYKPRIKLDFYYMEIGTETKRHYYIHHL